jgi:outer membrane protein
MSIKRVLTIGVSLIALAVGSAQADDLIQVYEQALHNDPTFKQAQSNWWSAKQNLPIAISAYLPQIEVTDAYERQYSKSRPAVVSTDGYKTQNVLTLTATQAIFDFNVWTNIAEQAASVKAATATYLASIQAEMANTATAYFAVLAAFDKLRFTISNKKAVKRQLVTAQQKFKVGLIAITGVYDAQARYDQANADEISDRNSLYDQLENLRAITGQHYTSLMGINVQVPLIVPAPDDIMTWVGTAVKQNYTLKSDNWTAIQAHRNILNVALGSGSGTGGYMPTVDATASWSRTNNFHYTNPIPGSSNSWTNGADVGLSLDWDPFSGGATYFSTKQARYNYLTQLGVLEAEHRNVINQTRQSFLGVKSSISRIHADKQSIISARNALQATEAGYTVGTRTMVNVLDDLTQVYQNENQYMDDQYAYINNFIALKENAGTLNVHDLDILNSWLKKHIRFALPKSYYGHTIPDDTKVMKKLKVLTKETPLMLTDNAKAAKAMHAKPKAQLAKASTSGKSVTGSRATKARPTKVMAKSPRVARTTLAKRSLAKPAANVAAPMPQPARNYVVQLYAGDTLKAAQKFVRSSKIGSHLNIVKRDNLYKVLYGHFQSRSDALIALDALPINHATNDAWVFKYVPPKQIPTPTQAVKARVVLKKPGKHV